MPEVVASDEIPPRQYYLSRREPETVPTGFRCFDVGSWHLVVDASFSAVPVVDGGERRGVVFGTILDPEDETDGESIRLERGGNDAASSRTFERALGHLLGRFVGLFDSSDGLTLYTDPMGALPCVYDEKRGVAAASPSAMPEMNHERRFRSDLFEAVRRPFISRGENVWLPGSITYYRDVERLLPNHSLNLDTWEVTRYWPSEQRSGTYTGLSEGITDITDRLGRIFETVESNYENPKMSLTAGKDSRSLLAAGRRSVTEGPISLFTIGESDRDVDVHVARRLASAHGLEWVALPIIEADEAARERWSWRTGHTIGSAVRETYTTMHGLEADVELGGIGGEIGRSYLWKASDEADTEIGPIDVLRRYHKPEHPELIATLEEWFEGVEAFDTYTTLDLAHQEHRLGGWGGPQHLGFRARVDHVRPFAYRPIIESMHELPPDARRNDRLPAEIIERCWPELSEFPYNEFTDWKKYWMTVEDNVNTARAALSNPGVAIEYLSQKYLRS